jgi:hypothetical protein
VLHLDIPSISAYVSAINEIVGEENRPAKGVK